MLSRLSSWHFAPTEYSAELLRKENIPENTIYVSGNTVVDALHWMVDRLKPRSLPGGLMDGSRKLILVTCHRRENLGLPMRSVALAIKYIAESHPEVNILFPMHPNPLVRESIIPILAHQRGVFLCEPLNYDEFLDVLKKSHIVLSDSGGVQEEATALGKPVLVLRRETEALRRRRAALRVPRRVPGAGRLDARPESGRHGRAQRARRRLRWPGAC